MTDSTDTEREGHTHLLNPETFARYLVRDRREVLQIMKALIDKRVLLTVHVDRGPSFITAVLAVTADGRSIILDAGPDETLNARAATASELVCTTKLDRVRIQFSLGPAEHFVHDAFLALRAELPESVLRLQRREFFRLAAPAGDTLSCTIDVRDDVGRKKSVFVRILDISNGGLAVIVPPAEVTFAAGMEFDECRLSLPDSEPLAVRLKVRNVFHVEKHTGVRVLRAGCEFIDPSNRTTALIQRYIFKAERDRKARESGL